MKDEAWVINLDEHKSIGTHWAAFMWMLIMQTTLRALE